MQQPVTVTVCVCVCLCVCVCVRVLFCFQQQLNTLAEQCALQNAPSYSLASKNEKHKVQTLGTACTDDTSIAGLILNGAIV